MGLPAVALGGTLLGGSSTARSAPKTSGLGPKGKIVRPTPGAAKVAGDYQLPEALRPTAELVLKKARHAFTTASANPKAKLGKNKLTSASAKFLGQLQSPRISRAKSRASSLLSASPAKTAAAFGPYRQWKATEYEMGYARDKDLADEIGIIRKLEKAKPPKTQVYKGEKIKREKPKKEPETVPPHYERLEFHLNTVTCIEDTNEFDRDEIKLGGQLIRPNGGVKQLDSFMVHDRFTAGVTKNYDSRACIGMSAAQRDILEDLGACNGHMDDPYRGKKIMATKLDGPWPGTYGLVLLMVEEDYGGFNNLLSELYAAIKDELDRAIAELGSSAAEAVASALGEAIGQVVGQIVVWVVTELVAWIVSLFDNVDDPLGAKSWVLQLPNANKDTLDGITAGGVSVPAGMRASALKEVTFVRDGGRYECDLHWRVTG